jgi:hypothetical protein
MSLSKAGWIAGALLFVVAFAYFVWPTEWAYTDRLIEEKGRGGSVTVRLRSRTSRLTGRRQVYTVVGAQYGWSDVAP